ncbi:hypothetical protein Dsin_030155 [Dipteronia sinensis]|uniref:Uncharacterized protein n=1 Tax=Dipteronia sinensis TaxID=43782 RepID=A0AAE0DQY6_9ROSI|nr:hypothetical protein Dsin_030155 [Dipteronia sinensis]
MSKPRTIKLFCPSLSKLVELVAWDEQRLDLGSIARGFGLDPSTVKINGHFISRGVDLVSNSVTWRSLLMFFSAKGLSTGTHDRDALVVDGKLTKVGTKRSYDCQPNHSGISRRPNPQNQKKKLKDSSSGDHHVTLSSGLGIKKDSSLEDLCFLNKLRLNETNTGCCFSDFRGNRDDTLGCRYLNENMKRPRENEVITPTLCKRIR